MFAMIAAGTSRIERRLWLLARGRLTHFFIGA
jgi:hypothetical protein